MRLKMFLAGTALVSSPAWASIPAVVCGDTPAELKEEIQKAAKEFDGSVEVSTPGVAAKGKMNSNIICVTVSPKQPRVPHQMEVQPTPKETIQEKEERYRD